MAITATLSIFDRADRRPVEIPATVRADKKPFDVTILNLSSTGFLANLQEPIEVGCSVSVGTASIGVVAARVTWSDGGLHGFEFDVPLSIGVVSGAAPIDNIVATGLDILPYPKVDAGAEHDEHVEKFSPAKRLMIIAGSSAASWAVVIAGAYAVAGLLRTV